MQNTIGFFMLRDFLDFRYMKSRFFVDLLGCFPWDAIYKVLYTDFHFLALVCRFFYSIRIEFLMISNKEKQFLGLSMALAHNVKFIPQQEL